MRIISEYQEEVKFIFRDLPLVDPSTTVTLSAQAAECADDQGKFLEMFDSLFLNRDIQDYDGVLSIAEQIGLEKKKFEDCIETSKYAKEVTEDLRDAIYLGVEGTPTFFLNGLKFQGAVSYEGFKLLIDSAMLGTVSE